MADNPHNIDANVFPRSNYAPTPNEEIMITALILKEENHLARLDELIEECKRDQETSQRDIGLLKNRISTAKLRMNVVSQLRDRARNALESTRQVEVPQYQPSTPSLGEKDDESMHHQQELDSIRQTYESIISGTLKQVEDTEALIKRQEETVALSQKELQGAFYSARISQMTLEATVVQRETLLESIQSKKRLFGPIFRVPPEVWTQIFQETAFEPPSLTSEVDWNTSSKPWRQPFKLSEVCYQWRVICHADPIMWRNAVVVLRNEQRGLVSDLRTHCSLSRGMLESLTLVTQDMDPLDSYTLLTEQFSQIKGLKILNCDITNNDEDTIPTIDWWPLLPPILELRICAFKDPAFCASGTLPPGFATSIKTATCKGTILEFSHPMPYLEEFILDIDIEGEYADIPGLFPLLPASKGSLRKLHIAANIGINEISDDEPVTLENLEDISLSIWNLLNFSTAFLCPSLNRVSIIDIDIPFMERSAWEDFFTQGDPSTTIKYLSIPSINCDEVDDIIPFISRMRGLDTLSLQGESVESIIQARTSVITAGTDDYDDNNEHSLPCFSRIQTLDIRSYTGTGDVVLQHIQAVQQANASEHAIGQHKLQEVTFYDCPNVTEATKASIRAHLYVS